jgi:trigger factor
MPTLVSEVARGKALALVVEKAQIVDASGRPVQLDRLQDDGAVADDALGLETPDVAFADFEEDVDLDEDDAELDEPDEPATEKSGEDQS